MIALGDLSLWLALLLAAWGAGLSVAGAVTQRADLSASGERGVHATAVFTALAIAGVSWALIIGDLTYRFVASWTSSYAPLPYRIAAVWSGPPGAMMLWALVLAVGTSVAAARLPRPSPLRAWTVALLAVMLLAVVATTCIDAQPFARLAFSPDDGRGMPLEWMRPIVLLQLPLGQVAMALMGVPAILTVMGAMGGAPWRASAQRWTMVCWSLISAAMLLDWRRRYGDAAWSDDWQWAPVSDGTAYAWLAAAVLAHATFRRWRSNLTIGAGFLAFTLALVGLSLRRTFGWEGVHEWAQSPAARVVGWLTLAAVVAEAIGLVRAARDTIRGASRGLVAAGSALLLAALALTASVYGRASDVEVREGERVRVADRFGKDWTLSLEGVSKLGRDNMVSTLASVRGGPEGRPGEFVTAEVRTLFSATSGRAIAEEYFAGIHTGLLQDLRVDVREIGTADALLTVRFVPAVGILWIAGIGVSVGMLLIAITTPSAASHEREAESPSAGVLA